MTRTNYRPDHRINHYVEHQNVGRKRMPTLRVWGWNKPHLTAWLVVPLPLLLLTTAPLVVAPVASAKPQQKAVGGPPQTTAPTPITPATPPPAYLSTLRMQVAPNSDNGPLGPVPPSAPGEAATEEATPEIIALGKRLFFDPLLSGSNKQSCASCHQPDHGYADARRLSVGDDGKTVSRNTPSLTNIAYSSLLFWDGRTNRLEEQALLPIQNPAEMNQKLPDLLVELKAAGYGKDFAQAFGGAAITEVTLARALSAYERTLTLTDTRYDWWMRGDKDALSYDALRGLLVFTSDKAGCVRCHSGPGFTRAAPNRSDTFVRLGLLPVPGDPKDLGRASVAAVTGVPGQPLRMSELFARAGAFRIPALRGVAQTAPYMHNGSLPTLEAVVDFYDRGGDENLLRPLGLTVDEKRYLVVFLREGLSRQAP